MSSFVKCIIPPTCKPPDPDKHVFYSHGMVLGEDDFVQEYAYLSGRDQWLARDLLGYGTVCGLEVFADTADPQGAQLVVTPGVALSPQGKLIRVDPAQCARLDDWLAQHKQNSQTALVKDVSGNSWASLYLTLAYEPCPTDPLPIPGEPCRSEDEAIAPSRIKDGFVLDLQWQAPKQLEEDALRDFVAWLHQIKINDSDPPTSLDDFETAVRHAAHLVYPPGSPPLSPPTSPVDSFPDYMYDSPPSTLVIPAANSCDYLRAAFRIWTTELRPTWMEAGQTCGRPPNTKQVLLAKVVLGIKVGGVSGDWTVDTTQAIEIDEDRRPYLVHLRMLQEWLVCGIKTMLEADLDGEVTGPIKKTRVAAILGIPVTTPLILPQPALAPKEGEVLTLIKKLGGLSWDHQPLPVSNTNPQPVAFGGASAPGTSTILSHVDHVHGAPALPPGLNPSNAAPPAIAFGTTSAAGNSADVSRADHVHGAPAVPAVPNPSSAAPSNVSFGAASAAGNSADFSRANHSHGLFALGGDVSNLVAGNTNSVTVNGLLGLGIDPTNANPGNVLTYQGPGNKWQIKPAAAAGNFVQFTGKAPYFIDAAGIVKGDGTSRSPAYNNLAAKVIANGNVLLTFDNYQNPDGSFEYIVKVLLVMNAPLLEKLKLSAPDVAFQEFRPDGILLFVWDSKVALPADSLKALEFMVEVSRYLK